MIKKLRTIVSEALHNINDNVSKRDINYLIKETFSISDIDLVINLDKEFDDDALVNKLKLLKEGMPVEYVLGHAYFCENKFKVTKDTLIPRNETEELVYKVKEYCKKENPRILDIGSGTGCIAITLNKLINGSKVDSVDISNGALEVAKENNILNRTSVNFYISDCFENVHDKFDVIVSNPPYIDEDSYVQESVIKYEPFTALFAKNRGLEIYERILKRASKYLNESYLIAFEISPEQKDELSKMVEENLSFSRYWFEEDMNNNIRFLFVER